MRTSTILVVDDEADLRNILFSILTDLADRVLVAKDGKEALEIAKTQEVDAILSDLSMPVMGGLKLLTEVRALGHETPFVVLTGFGDKPSMLEALRLGATDFLDKPFDESVLLEVMDKALQLGLALREIDKDLEQAFASSSLPPDKIESLKKARRSIQKMKAEMEIYTNNRKKDGSV